MTLSYITEINGFPTCFPEKIWAGLKHLEVTQELADFLLSDKSADVDISKLKPKLHSIRKDEKNKWKVGKKIHSKVWSGKPYRSKTIAFAPVLKAVSIQVIEITYPTEYVNDCNIKIDGSLLNIEQMQKLAWNDGFENLMGFYMYFNEDFKGKIIHWTELKY